MLWCIAWLACLNDRQSTICCSFLSVYRVLQSELLESVAGWKLGPITLVARFHKKRSMNHILIYLLIKTFIPFLSLWLIAAYKGDYTLCACVCMCACKGRRHHKDILKRERDIKELHNVTVRLMKSRGIIILRTSRIGWALTFTIQALSAHAWILLGFCAPKEGASQILTLPMHHTPPEIQWYQLDSIYAFSSKYQGRSTLKIMKPPLSCLLCVDHVHASRHHFKCCG